MKRLDLMGKQFGRLKVVDFAPNKGKHTYWRCICACGKNKIINTDCLISGSSSSCGCFRIENLIKIKTIHGQARKGKHTTAYDMYVSARKRSRKYGLPFNLKFPNDFNIPKYCPIFTNIKLKGGVQGKVQDSSPSLDRIIPKLGYVKGNVVIISNKANRIKNNGTYSDLMKVAKWLKKRINN